MANESGQEMCETLADIEADLRVMARKFIGYHGVGWCEGGRLMSLADRIEAAWRRERDELVYAYDPTKAGRGRLPDGSAYALEAMREPVQNSHAVGNSAAMREAINKALAFLETAFENEDGRLHFSDIVRIGNAKSVLKAALSAPARQCDVGTADEQSARYDEFCYQHRTIEHCCANCPVVNSATCELAWAQTPYEAEEGAGE